MCHFVRTYLRTVLDGVVQVFQHISVDSSNGRTCQVSLSVVTQNGDRTESLNQTVVGVGAKEFYLTLIRAVGSFLCVGSGIGGIAVE